MRQVLLAFLLLLPLLPSASAQGPMARIEPSSFEWNDFARSLAHFYVNVTNTGPTTDAFTIPEIRIEPTPRDPQGREVPTANIYSPTPTLVLASGATGTFHVWVGGFDQPSPPGPAAGDYRVDVRVVSTTDETRTHTVSSLIRRSFPPAPETGTIEGTVTDAVTGGPPKPGLRVHAADPRSVRVLPAEQTTTMLDAGGRFRFTLPAGTYWLRIEGPGYATAFLRDLVVTPGGSVGPSTSVGPATTAYMLATPFRTASLGLPSYRLATDLDMTLVAAMPGFYTKGPGGGAERWGLYRSDGTERWRAELPPTSAVPFDNAQWTSTDGAVDLSVDGRTTVIGTSGGTVSAYGAGSPTPKWTFSGTNEQNPRVPGPLGQGARRVSEVRYAPDLRTVAVGTLTGFVHLLDAETGSLKWTQSTAGQVRALRYTPGSDGLWVGSGDNRLYHLRLDDGAVLKTADLTFWPWEHIGMTASGDRIVTGGKDGVLRVFDAEARLLWSRQLPGFILGFDVAPGGSPIVAMGENGVYAYDPTGTLLWFRGEIQNTGKLAITATGRFVSYGKASTNAQEPTARIVTQDGTLAWEFRSGATPETVYNLAVRHDGSRIVGNGRSGNLYFFKDWQTAPPSMPDGGGTGGDGPTPRTGSPGPAGALALCAILLAVVAARYRRP